MTSKIAFNEDIGIPLTTKLTFEDDKGIPLTSDISFFKPNQKTIRCKVAEKEKKNGNWPIEIYSYRLLFCVYLFVLMVMCSYFSGSLVAHHVRKSKKKLLKKHTSPSSSLLQTKEVTKKHSLYKISSHSDLIQFIRTEKKLHKLKRSQKMTDNLEDMSKKFYTKDLDKLQVNMFNKEMKNYVRELKMIRENKKKEAALVETIRKRIKLWIK